MLIQDIKMTKIFITDEQLKQKFLRLRITPFDLVYGIPNGGNRLISWAVKHNLILKSQITLSIEQADYLLDDIIDSGNTINIIIQNKEKLNLQVDPVVLAPVNKLDILDEFYKTEKWIVFPWQNEQDFGYSGKCVIEKIIRAKNKQVV